jgi:[acyl-carrier-protein] S-malonyltransferase
MPRLLILCPGQGGQHPAMFDLARAQARAAEFLERCAPVADAAAIFENKVAQPSIVAATLAMWEALRERIPSPSLVAGYSIGELAAWGVAGALAPDDAVALAARRAALMDDAARLHPGHAMGAIGGVPVQRVRELAPKANFSIAIVTGHDSCIVGGLSAGLGLLEGLVTATGGKLQRLPVTVASHTSLMASAVAPFARALSATAFHPQRIPVLAGIAATRLADSAGAIDALSRQLADTIEWSACMDAAAETGITVALELGPGTALSRMLQARHPGIICRSVTDFRSIDGILAWLARQFD